MSTAPKSRNILICWIWHLTSTSYRSRIYRIRKRKPLSHSPVFVTRRLKRLFPLFSRMKSFPTSRLQSETMYLRGLKVRYAADLWKIWLCLKRRWHIRIRESLNCSLRSVNSTWLPSTRRRLHAKFTKSNTAASGRLSSTDTWLMKTSVSGRNSATVPSPVNM